MGYCRFSVDFHVTSGEAMLNVEFGLVWFAAEQSSRSERANMSLAPLRLLPSLPVCLVTSASHTGTSGSGCGLSFWLLLTHLLFSFFESSPNCGIRRKNTYIGIYILFSTVALIKSSFEYTGLLLVCVDRQLAPDSAD